jgi:oligopeptide transport system permease protein
VSDLKAYSKVLVMIVSLGLVEWLTMARIVRGQVLVLREMTFVTASKARWGRGVGACCAAICCRT